VSTHSPFPAVPPMLVVISIKAEIRKWTILACAILLAHPPFGILPTPAHINISAVYLTPGQHILSVCRCWYAPLRSNECHTRYAQSVWKGFHPVLGWHGYAITCRVVTNAQEWFGSGCGSHCYNMHFCCLQVLLVRERVPTIITSVTWSSMPLLIQGELIISPCYCR